MAFTTIHYNPCDFTACGTFVEIGLRQDASNITVFTEQDDNYNNIHGNIITLAGYNYYISFRIKVSQAGDVFMEYDLGSGWQIAWSSPYSIY